MQCQEEIVTLPFPLCALKPALRLQETILCLLSSSHKQDLIVVCLSRSIILHISSDHFSTSRSFLQQWLNGAEQHRRGRKPNTSTREFSFFTPPTFLHAEPFVPCVFQQCLQLKLSWSLLPGSISRSTECLWHSTLFAFNSFHSAPSVLNVAKYLIHFRHGGKRVLIFLTGIAGDQLVSESNIYALRGFCRLLFLYDQLPCVKLGVAERCHSENTGSC